MAFTSNSVLMRCQTPYEMETIVSQDWEREIMVKNYEKKIMESDDREKLWNFGENLWWEIMKGNYSEKYPCCIVSTSYP